MTFAVTLYHSPMAPRVFELRAKRIVAGAPGGQVIHLFDGLDMCVE